MEMVFMTSEELSDKFLNLLKMEKFSLFYIKTPAEYGWLGDLQK